MGRIARSSVNLVVAVAVAVATLLVAGGHGAITSCDQVTSALTPCYRYLLLGGSVPEGCCSGARSLVAAAATTQDRRTACSCIQSAASGYSGDVVGRASGLPGQCGVRAPFKISPSTDCSRIS